MPLAVAGRLQGALRGTCTAGWRGKLGPFSRCCLHGPVACTAHSKPLADMCVALTTLVAGLLGHSGSDTQPAKEDREGGGGGREVEWARCYGARTFDTPWAVHPSFCQPGCLAVQPCRGCSRSCSPRMVEQQDNIAWQSQGALAHKHSKYRHYLALHQPPLLLIMRLFVLVS